MAEEIEVKIINESNLTEWLKEPSINDLKANLDDAQSDQDSHIADVNRWLSNLYVTGSAKRPITKLKKKSTVVPKVIRKQAEWRYSSLSEPFLSTPDIFNVRPVTAGDRKRAKQNELVLNHQFNTKINKIAFIDSYVREAVNVGTVIVKVGWESVEEEITSIVPTYDYQQDISGQLVEPYTAYLQMQQQDPEGYADISTPGLDHVLEEFATNGVTLNFVETGEEEITEMIETVNRPTVEIMNENNIIIDPSCNGDLSKANFIGEKFKSSLSELKKTGKYENLEKINIEGASPLASPDYEENSDIKSFEFSDKARKQFVVHVWWGNWDIDGSGITKPIVAAWVGNVKIRMEENPYPDRKHPFVSAAYMPVRRSVFGEPDGELLEDNQKIIGAVTRGMIDLMGKSANSQTGMSSNLLDATNARKYKKGEDYEYNANSDPKQGIYQHKYPEIPQSAYGMIQMQNADAESLSGVKAFSSGINSQALGNSVGGGRDAMDAASKREIGILRRLAQGIIEIGRKIISMNAEFLDEEEVIRITAEEFVTVRRDDLAGDYDLQLTISTAEEDNKKAEELAFMLQTMGNNMDPVMSRMILSDIARLRKMPDMAKKIEDYRPEPDPMQVKQQELEILLLEAKIEKERALTAKHNAEAEMNHVRSYKEGTQGDLNTSKSRKEEAQARQLSSVADKDDLDYVETNTGVKHARELDKINVKSQNDAATKVIDAQAKNSTKGSQSA